MSERMVLGENRFYSLDCRKTLLNNNVLVVGTSGAGKTTGIVAPNLLEATGSYIVTDPKGNLYRKYGKYLAGKGYTVRKLDFTDPEHSAHYNFFSYIRSTQDIVRVAHLLTEHVGGKHSSGDPFWDEAAKLLLQSLISYLREFAKPEEQTLQSLLRLIPAGSVEEGDSERNTVLDLLMEDARQINPDSFAVKNYELFRVAASRTLRSILITLSASIGLFDTPELQKMMASDDISIPTIGKEKTALFVVVSDTDRSLDKLVNIFFTQVMQELCHFADKHCKDSMLPVPVRFIMDDFATNCTICDFPRMIASIRSRNISTMLMIQAESQLTERFDNDARTIIGNCDTYVYMGGNDIETAKAVAERCDVPLRKVLYMPVGTSWIFRRGEEPYNGKNCPPVYSMRREEKDAACL